jgi:hypothetical protein
METCEMGRYCKVFKRRQGRYVALLRVYAVRNEVISVGDSVSAPCIEFKDSMQHDSTGYIVRITRLMNNGKRAHERHSMI